MTIPEEQLGRLREAKHRALHNDEIKCIIAAKDEVIARFSRSFHPGKIENISEDVLRAFLRFENNRHWTGLHRQSNRICEDMVSTRKALGALVNRNLTMTERFAPALAIRGFGKGILTAILHVAYPDHYGVWNNTAVDALIGLGLVPAHSRGATMGEKYEATNNLLKEMALAIDVDLWTLDSIWWGFGSDDPDEEITEFEILDAQTGAKLDKVSFFLERHLHDFLHDNWESTTLGQDWDILNVDGDTGYEYVTPVGRIDLLARSKSGSGWLVIELKKGKSSDVVVGQVLRYMGWVKAHLAQDGEPVRGMIISAEHDSKLVYAVSATSDLSYLAYEVEFRLKAGPTVQELTKQ